MPDDKHKTFTLSVDLLLAIVLVLSIMAALIISSLDVRLSVLQETVDILEDHDVQMEQLKHELFSDLLKNKLVKPEENEL